jgi:primary-amine oxidase
MSGRQRIGIGVALVALGLTQAGVAQTGPPPPARHPLEPLTAAEIRAAVSLVQARPDVARDVLFPVIALQEPPKDEVRAYKPAVAGRREAFLVVLDRAKNQSFEAVVDLRAKSVRSFTPITGGQPLVTDVEMEIVRDAVRKDPAWQAAMKARNITNFNHVMIDPWAPGFLDPKTEPAGRRYVRALSYMRDTNRNGYGRPIEGVVALVDLGAGKVERVLDTGVRPIPPATDLPAAAGARRAAASVPIRGVSTNGDIRWNNWRFRVSVHPREGLVLHTVGWQDGDRLRSVLYRASLSEMLVPYADPERTWSFRNAFDAGEYGIGRLTTEMTPGADAPASAMFLPAVFADDHGAPSTRARAVAVYERDGGVLWKHYQFDDNPPGQEGGTNYSRRARELVVSWIATVGNYDYGLNWVFKEDGSLELEAFLTGIMLAKGVAAKTEGDHAAMNGTEGKYWHLVGPNVAAPHHQHFFNFRLDFDVDGSAPNAVREMNVRAEPGGGANPDGNAFLMEATPLREERDARRDLDLTRSRKWLVINPESRNPLGQPVGFLLAPGENSVPYLQPSSNIRQRAAFIDHHFWATQYNAAEMHAAGDYPNQSTPGDGLPKWTAPNRPLEGRDVVVWYTFAVTHVPRPEDWPVMTSHKTGFKLLPVSFFARNPAVR